MISLARGSSFLALSIWLVGGCGTSTPAAPNGGDTSTGGDSSSGAESSSSSGALPAESSSTGPDLAWPPDDGITECMRTCEGPFDCCPAGSEGSCPGAYPYNIDCIEGLCVPGRCESDDECPAADPPLSCRPVGGLPTCVTLCDDDPTVCMQPNTGFSCSAQTDEGEGYCFERCDSGFVPCANQTCDPDSGRCVCSSSGQCLNGWQCA